MVQSERSLEQSMKTKTKKNKKTKKKTDFQLPILQTVIINFFWVFISFVCVKFQRDK